MEFDYLTATPAEIREEAARRRTALTSGVPFVDRQQPSAADAGMRCVRLPWSVLIADNAKYSTMVGSGNERGRIWLTEEYRLAKHHASLKASEQLTGLAPLEGPVALEALLFEPDRKRMRDLSNYSKLVHDALNGLAYVDDRQIDRLTWIRAGVDIDAPRLEVTVVRIAP